MNNNSNYSDELNNQIHNQRIGDCFKVAEFDEINDPDLAFKYMCDHVKGIAIPATRTLAVAIFAHPKRMYAETGLLRDYLTDEMGFDMSVDKVSESLVILSSNVHRVAVDEVRGVCILKI